MKVRGALAALPVVLAIGAYAAFVAMTADHTPTLPQAYFLVGLLSRLIAALGCWMAAAQFDRGDYLRSSWWMLGAAFVLFAINAVLFGTPTHAAGGGAPALPLVSGLLVGAGNVCTVVGAVRMSRAWHVAGLDVALGEGARRLTSLGSLVLALIVVGPSAWQDLAGLAHGEIGHLPSLASAVGDIVTLAVLAPILLTALALRGGRLAWPWALLVLGTLGWLVHDAAGSLVSSAHLKPIEEAGRVLACLSFFSAGLLQRSASAPAAPAPPRPAV